MRCRIRSAVSCAATRRAVSVVKDTARERIRRNPCGRYGTGQDPLQVISLLLSEQESAKAGEREWHRSLIVCPASLVYNWQKEISRFAPQIKTTLVTGLAAERQRIVRHTKEGEVLITSYDLLKRDVELYRDMVFAIQVIDEAQYIKNPGTQAAKGVKADYRGFQAGADRNAD